jgi:group II intron reverse transcriptase/maturase
MKVAYKGKGSRSQLMFGHREASEMRDAETVLSIVHERGKRGLPLEDVYRLLYNPHLYIRAYDRLKINKGALTPGVTDETVDGMTLAKIQKIIELIKFERYRWTPARRVYIPKKSGKLRPLGLPTWSDKLVQEVMRSILEAYYEPQFSDHSHGFRPNRSCHTAITTVKKQWVGTRWFIEGDITKCFDKLDHDVLLKTLGEKIHDNRFLNLMKYMLKAGYLEKWKYNATYSGTPQGGVISPILANIYLDKLDGFVESELLTTYNRGKIHKVNPEYGRLNIKISYYRKKPNTGKMVHELIKQLRTMPSSDMHDPDYRRLKYIRYADDFLLGFAGPKVEAQEIKNKLRQFLQDELKLELSEEKTLITHATTEAARFLSYNIRTSTDTNHIVKRRRSGTGQIWLHVPRDVMDAKKAEYSENENPTHRTYMLNDSDYSIVQKYQSEWRGFVNYYKLAHNVSNLSGVQYVITGSLLKTLAAKHKSSVAKMAAKYEATIQTEYGPLKGFQVIVHREGKQPLVAQFGGIPLRRQEGTYTADKPYRIGHTYSDTIDRLMKQRCEMCGVEAEEENLSRIQSHHVHKLDDLNKKGKKPLAEWKKAMIARQRKTLIVCIECHQDITAGRPLRRLNAKTATGTGELHDAKVSRAVRRGTDGKVPA